MTAGNWWEKVGTLLQRVSEWMKVKASERRLDYMDRPDEETPDQAQ